MSDDTISGRAGRRLAGLATAAIVAVVAGLLAALPLLFTVMGVMQFSALIQRNWDPTWNDADGWFGLIGAVSLVLILGVTGLLGLAIGGVARMPAARTAWTSILGALLIAGTAVVLIVSRLSY